jgi:hypothetical protein
MIHVLQFQLPKSLKQASLIDLEYTTTLFIQSWEAAETKISLPQQIIS